MPEQSKRKIRKATLRDKLQRMLQQYKSVLFVTADNVGSNQMQKIRISLRGKAELLMGKNTLIRKVIREAAKENKLLETLEKEVVQNVGLVFTNHSLTEVRRIIEENKVPAAARSGALAPEDCFVNPGPTGLDPGQTGFFQSLNIATKIVKGAIEIISRVHILKAGEKVTASHVSLLAKLNIKPFFFKMNVIRVFEDGTIYDAKVLDISSDDLLAKFFNTVSQAASISLAIGEPTLASLPHSFARAFKNLLAVAVMTDVSFKQAESYKEYLANPAAWTAKHGGPAAAAPKAAPAAAAAPAKKEEPKKKESSDGDMFAGGLFD